LLPYLLGAAWAYAVAGAFDAPLFWSGLGGVVLAVIGVECFNEYFDAQMGTDRVFNPADVPPVTRAVFWVGTVAFAGALAVGVYRVAPGMADPRLACWWRGGDLYEAPRSAGLPRLETVIALSHGPWMVSASLPAHPGFVGRSGLR
jgi:1,4-dihydroxy-2-naphthoate octaprenyltransferase